MNQIPFTGNSRTLVQSTPRNLNLEPRSLIQKILGMNRNSSSRTLEEIIDADDNLEIYSNNQLNSLNPKTLYGINQFSYNSSLYRHQREESLHIPDGQTNTLNLINSQSYNKIRERKHNYIHLGMIGIGIRTLIRKGTGAMALLILYDDRHKDPDRSIIGFAEIDLNSGSAITYIVPDFVMTIRDFSNHIKLAFQVRGFENFTGNNLAIDIIFLGKTMTHIRSKFKLQLKNLIDAVSSKGIKFIPAKQISSETLAGLEWNINLNLQDIRTIKPNQVSSYTDRLGNMSIRFDDYIAVNNPEEDNESETQD